MPDPLTSVDALVAAAVMAHHERRQPTWAGIADRLTAWAHEQPQTEHEEGEMPSQDRVSGSADGTLGSRNRAVPQGAQTPGGPNRSTSTDLAGDEQL
jgi:hypothetical protein